MMLATWGGSPNQPSQWRIATMSEQNRRDVTVSDFNHEDTLSILGVRVRRFSDSGAFAGLTSDGQIMLGRALMFLLWRKARDQRRLFMNSSQRPRAQHQ